jgi:hypothetical protein
MEKAFAAGYDPALELATHYSKQQQVVEDALDELTFDQNAVQQEMMSDHMRRREQDWIDRIVHGADTGHYYVLLGPKVRCRLSLNNYSRLIVYDFRGPERRP